MCAKKTKSQLVSEENKKEIFYNIINSLLSGGLVLLGGIVSGGFSKEGCLIAVVTSCIVAITKFKKYWDGEESEYSQKLANFF